MRLDTLKQNKRTLPTASQKAKLIYCCLKVHCSTARCIQADESEIANSIGLDRKSGLNPFGNVVVLAMEDQVDSAFNVQGDYDFILVKGIHKKQTHGK